MSRDGLPPLREVIARHELQARKSLGQNFILDLNLTAKIARTVPDLAHANVYEVGPGPGGLTRGLLSEGARHVLAVERDQRCLPVLAEIATAYPGRLTYIHADAREVDPAVHLSRPIRVAANLPYNVGTQLLTGWLDPLDGAWPPAWSSLTLMFQREVAERIVARVATAAYGRLSVLATWRTHARIVMDLPPSAFVPAPRVRSAVVELVAREQPLAEAPPDALRRVVAAGFNQRRKMLRSALRTLDPDVEERLQEVGIAPTARAEEVDVPAWCALARSLG